jgi:hypothetical protein
MTFEELIKVYPPNYPVPENSILVAVHPWGQVFLNNDSFDLIYIGPKAVAVFDQSTLNDYIMEKIGLAGKDDELEDLLR